MGPLEFQLPATCLPPQWNHRTTSPFSVTSAWCYAGMLKKQCVIEGSNSFTASIQVPLPILKMMATVDRWEAIYGTSSKEGKRRHMDWILREVLSILSSGGNNQGWAGDVALASSPTLFLIRIAGPQLPTLLTIAWIWARTLHWCFKRNKLITVAFLQSTNMWIFFEHINY